ncbi:MAG: ABC transporter permease subunit [Acidobacteria bacterium]|nr:ABC transporter permease subunit [Acidobacteriota bacterium]
MSGRLWAIANHTFKEAVRDRILVLFLIFAFAMMAASTVLSWLTVGSELKIVTDLGLGALAIFGTAIAIFIGITLVHKEVEKKTIYAVLAKPVSRWEFLVGKYFGLMLTLAVVTGLMAVFYTALVWWKGGEFPSHLFAAVLLTYMELSIITAVALVFSSFTTPMLAAVFTVAVYVVGHLTWGLASFVDLAPGAGTQSLVTVLYYILPDLETFNIRSRVVHRLPVTTGYVVDAVGYSLAYTAGMLALATVLFRRRDLT